MGNHSKVRRCNRVLLCTTLHKLIFWFHLQVLKQYIAFFGEVATAFGAPSRPLPKTVPSSPDKHASSSSKKRPLDNQRKADPDSPAHRVVPNNAVSPSTPTAAEVVTPGASSRK